MSTTVGQIISAVSQDVRGLLGTTGGDQTILLDYVNRTHQDLLRQTRWVFLKSGVQSFTTSSGVYKYWIGQTGSNPVGTTDTLLNLTDIFTIDENSVYDRTNFKQITRTGEVPLGADWTSNNYPKLYRNDSTSPYVLELYPYPNGTYTIEFRYFKTRTIFTLTTDLIQIPDDYKDVLVDGVCARVYELLKMQDDADRKFALYKKGLIDMLRDKNLFPKSNNFIRPDSV
jgi:hypothetical protein